VAKLVGVDTELTLRPHRASDRWLLSQLRLETPRGDAVHTTIIVTRPDLHALRTAIADVVSGIREEARVASTDADFIFEVERLPSPGDVSVRFWLGEPNAVMRGWRFIAKEVDLSSFAQELEADEKGIQAPGRLA